VLLAEREAAERLRQIRARLADAIHRAVASGTGYSTLARVSFGVRAGRSPTLVERLREARRPAKLTSRHRRNIASRRRVERNEVQPNEEVLTMPNEPRLVSRKIIEERYETDDADLDDADLDDADLDDADLDEAHDLAHSEVEPEAARAVETERTMMTPKRAERVAACPLIPARWRFGNWREREACRGEAAAERLVRKAQACIRKGPPEVDCSGFLQASDVLKAYATRLRSAHPRSRIARAEAAVPRPRSGRGT
jgi:hypothetical protein